MRIFLYRVANKHLFSKVRTIAFEWRDKEARVFWEFFFLTGDYSKLNIPKPEELLFKKETGNYSSIHLRE